MAPYDAEDARGLMKAAIRDPDPVVFLENEILYGESFPIDEKVLDKDFTLPIGKCKVRLHSLKPSQVYEHQTDLAALKLIEVDWPLDICADHGRRQLSCIVVRLLCRH